MSVPRVVFVTNAPTASWPDGLSVSRVCVVRGQIDLWVKLYDTKRLKRIHAELSRKIRASYARAK